MSKQEVVNLMQEAGFSTDWLGYGDVRDTVAKYEKFAELIEVAVRERCGSVATNPAASPNCGA